MVTGQCCTGSHELTLSRPVQIVAGDGNDTLKFVKVATGG